MQPPHVVGVGYASIFVFFRSKLRKPTDLARAKEFASLPESCSLICVGGVSGIVKRLPTANKKSDGGVASIAVDFAS